MFLKVISYFLYGDDNFYKICLSSIYVSFLEIFRYLSDFWKIMCKFYNLKFCNFFIL